jgi:hypothetical protein
LASAVQPGLCVNIIGIKFAGSMRRFGFDSADLWDFLRGYPFEANGSDFQF